MRLVLASASPRRAELLMAAGYSFDTLAVEVDETPLSGEAPATYVRRLAMDKSARGLEMLTPGLKLAPTRLGPARLGPASGHQRDSSPPTGGSHEGFVVLGADTAVVVDGEVLGKPRDDDEARAMLCRLSGRSHDVMTAISVRTASDEINLVETTKVSFALLTPEAVAWYVATGEGRDKAGAYAIQGLASRFIPRIEGSYSNVVGLPVAQFAETLSRLTASNTLPARSP